MRDQTGGALAGRLSGLSGKRILVLEGGPLYPSPTEMHETLLRLGSIGAAVLGSPNWSYPAIPSRGPNATAMMVGERLANLLA